MKDEERRRNVCCSLEKSSNNNLDERGRQTTLKISVVADVIILNVDIIVVVVVVIVVDVNADVTDVFTTSLFLPLLTNKTSQTLSIASQLLLLTSLSKGREVALTLPLVCNNTADHSRSTCQNEVIWGSGCG